MSMKFAGFMQAAREDRLRREEKEEKDRLWQREKDFQLELRSLDTYQKQKLKDKALRQSVSDVASLIGATPDQIPALTSMISAFGVDGFMKQYQSEEGINWDAYAPVTSTSSTRKQPSFGTLTASTASSMSKLEPLDVGDDDVMLLARTLQAEAGDQGKTGMLAVGAVIRNRMKAGRYGKGLRGVIMKPGQFSAWNSVTGYARGEQGQNMNFQPGEDALEAAQMIVNGDYIDFTEGATHYYNPAISQPSWGNDSFRRFGDHVFGFGDGDPGADRPANQGTTARRGAVIPPGGSSKAYGPKDLSEDIAGADSAKKAMALVNSLEVREGVDPGYIQAAQRHAKDLMEMEAKKAVENNEYVTFIPRGDDGVLSETNQITAQMRNGEMVDIRTGQPIDTPGIYITGEDIRSSVKVQNQTVKDARQARVAGIQALDAAAELRKLVIENPEAVNPLVNLTRQFTKQVGNVQAFLNTLQGADYETAYRELDGVLGKIHEAGSAEYALAQAQLRLAYNIAAIRGSSGQALSDKELKQNLEAIGEGLGDPRSIMDLLNRSIRVDILQGAEAKRSAAWSDLSTDPVSAATYSNHPLSQPFGEYIRGYLSEQGRTDALQILEDVEAGKTDYWPSNAGSEQNPAPVSAEPEASAEQPDASGPVITATPEMIENNPALAGLEGRQVRVIQIGPNEYDLIPVEDTD